MARSAAFPRPALALVAAAAALLLPLTTEGATHQLSQGQSFSEICVDCNGMYYNHLFSPDGKWAVYAQDAETDGHYALWSAPVAGGAPVRLSATLGEDDRFQRFRVSLDSSRVVYLTDTLAEGTDLYSVPIVGPASASIRLNPELPPTSSIYRFDLTPSGDALYQVTDWAADWTNLWRVKLDGGPSLLVNVPLGEGDGVYDFWFEPVTARVLYTLYRASVGPDTTVQLWSVPLEGGNQELLAEITAPVRRSFYCIFIPDGTRAICEVVDSYSWAPSELWSYPLSGGPGARLDAGVPPGGEGVAGFESSPDSARVVYASDHLVAGTWELWSVPAAGGPSARLNAPLAPNGDVGPWGFAISPDSQRVVYLADAETAGVIELWSTEIAGGDSIKLNPPLVAGGNVSSQLPGSAFPPLFSAEGSRVLYIADQEVDNRYELWAVPTLGGAASRLSPTLPDGTWLVSEVRLGAGAEHVFFRLDHYPSAGGINDYLIWSPIEVPSAQIAINVGNPWLHPVNQEPSPVSPREVLFASGIPDYSEQLFLADTCVLCDGFESGLTVRWSAVSP